MRLAEVRPDYLIEQTALLFRRKTVPLRSTVVLYAATGGEIVDDVAQGAGHCGLLRQSSVVCLRRHTPSFDAHGGSQLELYRQSINQLRRGAS